MKFGVGQRALAIAAFSLFTAGMAAPAVADTSAEIRALKARLNRLEAQEAEAKREAKAAAAASTQHAAAGGGHGGAAGAPPAPQHWYERISLRGYTQMRYNAILDGGTNYNDVGSVFDRSLGPRQNFLIRRMRLIFSGDVTDHLYIYIQPDLASAPPNSFSPTPTVLDFNPGLAFYNRQVGTYGNAGGYFAQLRDAYADISVDKDKEFRFRVGQSKIPFGFENMQSSQNRLALDRADAINICCRDERDLGIFFYYAPKEMRHLFRDLVKNNLKGSGDYGMIAFGVYNGQGANRIDLNRNLHLVGRFTYPYVFENGQIVEASIQGITGRFMPVTGSINPSLGMATDSAGFRPPGLLPSGWTPIVNAPGYNNLGNFRQGTYPSLTSAWAPSCVNGCQGVKDDRVAVTGIIYPQPFGLFAEWMWGRSPTLDATQTYISSRSTNGGYVLATYKYDDKEFGLGTLFPFVKWQYYNGGSKFETNAPLQRLHELDIGLEWQPLPEVEISATYTKMNRTNVQAAPYRQFSADLLRMQLQWNY